MKQHTKNNRSRAIGAGLVLFLLALSANADCGKLINPQDILACALKQHPSVLQAEAQGIQGKFLNDVAAQRPNPELDGSAAVSSAQGQGLNSQISLSHIFELGGKRGARIEKATAENEVISADILKAKEEVALNTISALFRLRQIQAEIATLEEALHTFYQIKAQLKTRPRLTPDQLVALNTFQLVEGDYRLRRLTLRGERQALIQAVNLAIGAPIEMEASLLPKPMNKWPEFQLSIDPAQMVGSNINRLRAELKTAEADLSLARSASWPNLKIGPSFQNQNQIGGSNQSFGLVISVPLPLYQANAGGRAFAFSGLSRAELTLNTGTNQLRTERDQEILRYQAAVSAMSESTTLREIEKRHQDIERLFRGGLIQSSMVIEAHRQVVDLTRAINEQELRAIRSLWRIYAIEGRVLKETI